MKIFRSVFVIFLLLQTIQAKIYSPIKLNSEEITDMGIGLFQIKHNPLGKGIPFSAVVDFDDRDGYAQNSSLEVIVVAIYKREGEKIKKGDRIAEVSSNELNNLYFEYQNTLSRLKVAQEIEKKDRSLFNQGVIPQREYQTSYLSMNELQLKLKELAQAFNIFGIDVDNPRGQYGFLVRANGSGTLSIAPTYVGQKIPAFSPFVRISKSNAMLARIRVPLSMVDSVKRGYAILNSNGKNIGYLKTISVVLDQVTNTISAIADLKGDGYKVGEIIELYVAGSIPKNALLLPSSTIIKNDNDYLVFLKLANGFQPIAVNILEEREDSFMISAPNLHVGSTIANGAIITLKGIVNGIGEGE